MTYSKKLVGIFEHPENVGSFDANDPCVGTGIVGSPACGDVMKVQIKVSKDGIIEDACFKTFGCGSAIASSSVATHYLKGLTLEQALTLKNSQIADDLTLPPVKIHCSLLAEEAIKTAINDYKQKHERLLRTTQDKTS